MVSEKFEMNFICQTYASSYEKCKLINVLHPFFNFINFVYLFFKPLILMFRFVRRNFQFLFILNMNLIYLRLYLHVPNTEIWVGKIFEDSMYIENLHDLMIYHKINPYHLILLDYLGGLNFKINIFNPYGVEIN